MVAYSFRRRFAEPIRAGSKRQTIRASRKRDPRPGEWLQLYCGLRTRYAEKIVPDVRCEGTWPIRLEFFEGRLQAALLVGWVDGWNMRDLDAFARDDGFADASDLSAFWQAQHGPDLTVFVGVLIRWAGTEHG